MQAMEQNLIGMVREVEKLRAEVSNAEKRARGNFFLPVTLVLLQFENSLDIVLFT